MSPTLGGTELDPDPLVQFGRWYAEAGTDEVALSTVSTGGWPSSRMVLLKEHGPDGFVFYTNYESDKGIDLAANPRAALLFRWLPDRQVRVVGGVREVSRARTERYWRTRERGSQLSAWVSRQSRPVASRQQLEAAVEELDRRFVGMEVPCPPRWGGYLVTPSVIELWQQGEHRLHDRIRYRRSDGATGKAGEVPKGSEPEGSGASAWSWERLAP